MFMLFRQALDAWNKTARFRSGRFVFSEARDVVEGAALAVLPDDLDGLHRRGRSQRAAARAVFVTGISLSFILRFVILPLLFSR